MKSFTVTQNDAGQRLDKFLTKAVPLLPHSLLYKYIRLKRIKVNHSRAQIDQKLVAGDLVELYINDEFFAPVKKVYPFASASRQLDVVYEDENILLVNKREGLLVHEDAGEYRDTLILRIQRYLFEKGEYRPEEEHSFAPALANRIDRNTCGIVIAAKNAEALRILNEKIKSREIRKKYLCLVHHEFRERQGILTGYLEKDAEKNQVFVSDTPAPGRLEIRTGYRVVYQKNDIALLEIDLLTGRTHQIRAQMAHIGHPLVGDGKYGKNASDKKKGFSHQALCSYFLEFTFPSEAGALNYLRGRSFSLRHIWFAEEFLSGEQITLEKLIGRDRSGTQQQPEQ